MPHPWIDILPVLATDPASARVVAFSITGSGTGGIGPFERAMWIQLHGLTDSRLSYTLVPPPGGLGGVSPDAAAVPVSGFPLALPLGASLVINNTGAGTRAFTASIWPMSGGL